MTVKKAIQILDIFIQRNHQMVEGLLNPEKLWNTNLDSTKQLAQTIADLTDEEIQVLELIKMQLQPKCRHPKNMRDKVNEVWYCMNCNQDL